MPELGGAEAEGELRVGLDQVAALAGDSRATPGLPAKYAPNSVQPMIERANNLTA